MHVRLLMTYVIFLSFFGFVPAFAVDAAGPSWWEGCWQYDMDVINLDEVRNNTMGVAPLINATSRYGVCIQNQMYRYIKLSSGEVESEGSLRVKVVSANEVHIGAEGVKSNDDRYLHIFYRSKSGQIFKSLMMPWTNMSEDIINFRVPMKRVEN